MPDQIPVLDLSDFLAGKPGALEQTAADLRRACERVGFYFITGHGVDWGIVDGAFEASRRFHALPLERKLAVKANHHNTGYMPSRTSISRASKVYDGVRKQNLVAAYSVKRDLPPDHPDVLAEKRFRAANPWPEDLPGFREACTRTMDALEGLAKSMLPLYAVALDLAPDFFEEAFQEPQYSFRLAHYPPLEAEDNQFGIAPHTDSSFMTLLAQNEVPGLQIRPPDGDWMDAPVLSEAFLVNTGDLLHRWSNHRFRPTPHRAVASAPGVDRYAIPFFFDASNDYVMECLPTCHGPDNPPRYDPITYSEYMEWFGRQNYAHFNQDAAE